MLVMLIRTVNTQRIEDSINIVPAIRKLHEEKGVRQQSSQAGQETCGSLYFLSLSAFINPLTLESDSCQLLWLCWQRACSPLKLFHLREEKKQRVTCS